MKQSLLSLDEVLIGHDAISQVYPHIPSLSTWRAWEYAAYQRYTLPEPDITRRSRTDLPERCVYDMVEEGCWCTLE